MARTQVDLTKKTDVELMRLQAEVKGETGKRISKSSLIRMILEDMPMTQMKQHLRKMVKE